MSERSAKADRVPTKTQIAPRAGNKKVEQRLTSMELLLEAALRLFVAQGYRSTNLEQIAGAAKLTKGAVYFYFRSKEAVLIALLERVRRIVVDDAIAIVHAAGPTPTDKLVAYIHYQANLGITHRDEVLLLLLMALEFKGRGGEAHDFLAKLYKRQCLFIESLVKTGQARESFAPTCVPRELASIVLGAHDGTFLEWFRRPAALRGAELVRARRSTVFARTVSRHFEFFKVRNYVDIFFGRPMFLLRSVKSLSKGVEDEKESKWARPFVGDGGGCIDGVAVDGCLCG